MSRNLLASLNAHEAEVLAMLFTLYAEVRHWERELADTRKAKRAAAIAMEAQRGAAGNTDATAEGGDSAGPQDIAQKGSQ